MQNVVLTPINTVPTVFQVKKTEFEKFELSVLRISNMKRESFKFGTSFDTLI